MDDGRYNINPMDLVRHWFTQMEYQRAYDEALIARKSSRPPSDSEMRKLAGSMKEAGQLDLAVNLLLAIDDPASVLNIAKGFKAGDSHAKAVKLFLAVGAYTEVVDTLKAAPPEVVKDAVKTLIEQKAFETVATLRRDLEIRAAEKGISEAILEIDSRIAPPKPEEAQVPEQAAQPVPAQMQGLAAQPVIKAVPVIIAAPPKVELPKMSSAVFQAIATNAAQRIGESCAKNIRITITEEEFISICKALTCQNEEKLKLKVSSTLIDMFQKGAPANNLTKPQFDVLYNTLEQFLVYLRQVQDAVAPRKAATETRKLRSEEEIVTENLKQIISNALVSASTYARSCDELPDLRKKLNVLLGQDSAAMRLPENIKRLKAINAAKQQISECEAVAYMPFEMNDAVFNAVCRALDPESGRKDLRDAALASLPDLGAVFKGNQERINALSSAAYKAIEFDAILETGSIADFRLRISVLESLPMLASSFSLGATELGYLNAKGANTFIEVESHLTEKNTRTVLLGLGQLNDALSTIGKELDMKIPNPEGFSYTISKLLEMISTRTGNAGGNASPMDDGLGLDRKAFHKPTVIQGSCAAPIAQKGKVGS